MMILMTINMIVATRAEERFWTRMDDEEKTPQDVSSAVPSFLGGAKTRNVNALRTFFSKIDFDNDGQLDAEELKKYVAQAIGGIEFDEREEIESASEETIKQMDKQ